MKTIKLSLFLFFVTVFTIKAQTTAPVIYDMVTTFESITDTSAQAQDTVTIRVLFKVRNMANLSQAYIKLGNAQDNGNFINETFNVSLANGIYSFSGSSQQPTTSNKMISFKYKLLKSQIADIQWCTVWGKDNENNLLTKQFYKCY